MGDPHTEVVETPRWVRHTVGSNTQHKRESYPHYGPPVVVGREERWRTATPGRMLSGGLVWYFFVVSSRLYICGALFGIEI